MLADSYGLSPHVSRENVGELSTSCDGMPNKIAVPTGGTAPKKGRRYRGRARVLLLLRKYVESKNQNGVGANPRRFSRLIFIVTKK